MKSNNYFLPVTVLFLFMAWGVSAQAQQAGLPTAFEHECKQIQDFVDREICLTQTGITYLESRINSTTSSGSKDDLLHQLQTQRQKLTRLKQLNPQERKAFAEQARAAHDARLNQR